MAQLGESQFGDDQIGEVDQVFDYPTQFQELQETADPAGPDFPADRMYSNIKPAFRPRENDNWSALVEDFAKEFEALADGRKEVIISRYVEIAFGNQLDKIGQLVQLERKTGESDEHYRTRLIVEFKKISTGGTIDDLKELSSAILDTDSTNIKIEEPSDIEPARVDVAVHSKIIKESGFSVDEYAGYLREIKAAGVKLQGKRLGGFTHRSEADFKNGVNNPDLGYNRGEYAGLF